MNLRGPFQILPVTRSAEPSKETEQTLWSLRRVASDSLLFGARIRLVFETAA